MPVSGEEREEGEVFVSCARKFYANAELNRIEASSRASHAFARGSYHSVLILYVIDRSEPKSYAKREGWVELTYREAPQTGG